MNYNVDEGIRAMDPLAEKPGACYGSLPYRDVSTDAQGVKKPHPVERSLCTTKPPLSRKSPDAALSLPTIL